MKKRYLALSVLLAVILVMPVYAQTYAARNECDLSFAGSTAYCSVSILRDDRSDEISAVVKLWDGSRDVAEWSADGTGRLDFYETKTVTPGRTYKLTVDYTVNGKSQPQLSTSAACPK